MNLSAVRSFASRILIRNVPTDSAKGDRPELTAKVAFSTPMTINLITARSKHFTELGSIVNAVRALTSFRAPHKYYDRKNKCSPRNSYRSDRKFWDYTCKNGDCTPTVGRRAGA